MFASHFFLNHRTDGKALDAFVKAFLAGELTPYLKSEPAPSSNDGPVKVFFLLAVLFLSVSLFI